MRTRWIMLLAALALSPALASAQTTRSGSGAVRDIDAFVQKLLSMDLLPGVAVAVVVDTAPVLVRGYGWADIERREPVTEHTAYYIASSTKSFTALATALLAQRGALELRAPLRRYLPAAQLHAGLSADSITIQHLLTHSHGIDGDGPITWRTAYTGEHTPPQLLAALQAHPPNADAPLGEYEYSNVGYNILSMVLDRVTGISWKDLLERELMRPLGMTRTTAHISRFDSAALAMPYVTEQSGFSRARYAKKDANMQAAGGLVSTASDLARWLEAQINDGMLDGKQIFAAAVVAETQRRHIEFTQQFGSIQRVGYGYGWNIGLYEGDTLVHHYGGFQQFRSHVSFMPQHRIGVAVLTSGTRLGGMTADIIARCAYDRLLEKPGYLLKYDSLLVQLPAQAQQTWERISADRARRAARPQGMPLPLAAYAGRYQHPLGGTMVVRVVGERLYVTAGVLESPAEAFDATKHAIRVELEPGSGSVLTFQVQADQVSGLSYGPYTFTRAPEALH